MATLDIQGTSFTFSVLSTDKKSNSFLAKTEVIVQNAYVDYRQVGEYWSYEEIENWIFSMFRLLAGGYGTEKSVAFERSGLAVDLYPHTENGEEVSREERRNHDCIMAIRLLFRKDSNYLGGVYTPLPRH